MYVHQPPPAPGVTVVQQQVRTRRTCAQIFFSWVQYIFCCQPAPGTTVVVQESRRQPTVVVQETVSRPTVVVEERVVVRDTPRVSKALYYI